MSKISTTNNHIPMTHPNADANGWIPFSHGKPGSNDQIIITGESFFPEYCVGDYALEYLGKKGHTHWRPASYNLPHDIIGPVVELTPGHDTCNIQVRVMRSEWVPYYHDGDGDTDRPAHWAFEPYTEYGTCGQFKLLHRPGYELVRSTAMVWRKKE